MKDGPDIARVAALIGDPARANMLVALMDGGALTATELATESGITKQTASAHLARLREGGLVAVTAQGRHRYFTLRDSDVAAMLEAIMGVAAGRGLTRLRPGPREPALRKARICYDHLAGELGVALYASLTSRGWIVPGEDGPLPTEPAAAPLSALGIDLAGLRAGRRVICRECLDWSVRKPHLAGALGAALLDSILARGWAKRVEGTRVIAFSTSGEAAFRETLLAA